MPATNGGPHCRLSSPRGGGSTFITCAHISAISIVQTGPDRIRERSRTKKSSSGLIFLETMYFFTDTAPDAAKAYQLSGPSTAAFLRTYSKHITKGVFWVQSWLKFRPFLKSWRWS